MLLQLRIFYHVFKLSSNPEATSHVFRIGELSQLILSKDDRKYLEDICLTNANFQKLMASNNASYLTGGYDVESLYKYPKNSLGFAYADFLMKNKLVSNFYDEIIPTNVLQYYSARTRKTHDIYHVLTGFGRDAFGELGLQAFLYSQMPVPSQVYIVVSGFLFFLRRRRMKDLRGFIEAIVHGFVSGKKAKSLLGIEFEKLWDRDLNALREEFEIRTYTKS